MGTWGYDVFSDDTEPASGADFRRLATVHTFGDSWTRGALDTRSRAMVSVAIEVFTEAEGEQHSGS